MGPWIPSLTVRVRMCLKTLDLRTLTVREGIALMNGATIFHCPFTRQARRPVA